MIGIAGFKSTNNKYICHVQLRESRVEKFDQGKASGFRSGEYIWGLRRNLPLPFRILVTPLGLKQIREECQARLRRRGAANHPSGEGREGSSAKIIQCMGWFCANQQYRGEQLPFPTIKNLRYIRMKNRRLTRKICGFRAGLEHVNAQDNAGEHELITAGGIPKQGS